MSSVVRAVRQQRGMTLDTFAAETGLTKSYLSKVERGQCVPSIATALKMAKFLEVDVARLFSEDPEITTIAIDRAADRSTDRHVPVAPDMLGKAMSPFVVRPAREFLPPPHPTHPGQEAIFVHTGRIEFDYDGEIVELETGDCAYFNSENPHRMRRVGREIAVVLVVAHQQRR